MANLVIKLSGTAPNAAVKAALKSDKRLQIESFMRGLITAVGPSPHLQVQIQNNDSALSSGIITIVDYTKATANDTYQIGSLILTAKSSGATTNQFNIGASNNDMAANLAAAINAYGAGFLIASASSAVVTVQVSVASPIANYIPMIITATTGGSATCSASLSSGANDSGVFQDYRSF